MKPTDNIIQHYAETSSPDEAGRPINPPDNRARIAELAYYKAEKRGFEPGHELEDWLEAEREFASLENKNSIADESPRTKFGLSQ